MLAEPPKSGFDLTAWLVPGAAILLAAVGIAIGLRRWRRAAGDAGPRRRRCPPLEPAEAERLTPTWPDTTSDPPRIAPRKLGPR